MIIHVFIHKTKLFSGNEDDYMKIRHVSQILWLWECYIFATFSAHVTQE